MATYTVQEQFVLYHSNFYVFMAMSGTHCKMQVGVQALWGITALEGAEHSVSGSMMLLKKNVWGNWAYSFS